MRALAVLVSGRGTNLQALMDAGLAIACVISDRADAGALERASLAGIPAILVDPTGANSRDEYDAMLEAVLARHGVELVVLAGFMRILGSAFVKRWSGRMVNIHPSLLPRHRGLHTHRRVLEAGDTDHGASVHFVNEQLDGGAVIVQAHVPVLPDDNEQSLARRVQAEEHRVYPWVVRILAEGRIVLRDEVVELNGTPLAQPLQVHPGTDLSCLAA